MVWRQLFPDRPDTHHERIRIREVRLIDRMASKSVSFPRLTPPMARERGLDLVEVAPHAMPPVCRLMDYGNFRYEQTAKSAESRRHQHVIELKESYRPRSTTMTSRRKVVRSASSSTRDRSS